MGILNPVCAATDGDTIFALAYASSYSDLSSSYNILIKSNKNPSYKLDDLVWTLISVVPRDGYYYLGEENINARGYSCSVDSAGVFTAIAYSSKESKLALADNIIRGLQYQPSGVWKNISTSPQYVWTEGSISQLYSVKDPATGTSTLMHVSVASPNGTVSTNGTATSGIALAALNPQSLVMTQNPSLWIPEIGPFGIMRGVAFAGDDTLYIMGQNQTNSPYYYSILASTTIAGGSTIIPASNTMVPFNSYTVSESCGWDLKDLNMMPWGNLAIIICTRELPGSRISEYFNFNATFLSPYSSIEGPLTNVRSMIAVRGSVSSFMFMHNSTGVYGFPLEGSFTGIWQSSTNRISITDAYGINGGDMSTGNSIPPQGSNTNNSSTHGKAGLIGGICAAIVVAIVITGLLVHYRRRTKRSTLASTQEVTKKHRQIWVKGQNGELIPCTPDTEISSSTSVAVAGDPKEGEHRHSHQPQQLQLQHQLQQQQLLQQLHQQQLLQQLQQQQQLHQHYQRYSFLENPPEPSEVKQGVPLYPAPPFARAPHPPLNTIYSDAEATALAYVFLQPDERVNGPHAIQPQIDYHSSPTPSVHEDSTDADQTLPGTLFWEPRPFVPPSQVLLVRQPQGGVPLPSTPPLPSTSPLQSTPPLPSTVTLPSTPPSPLPLSPLPPPPPPPTIPRHSRPKQPA